MSNSAGTRGKPTIKVVGGGYAGVELATCVADRLGGRASVEIISGGGTLLPVCPALVVLPWPSCFFPKCSRQ